MIPRGSVIPKIAPLVCLAALLLPLAPGSFAAAQPPASPISPIPPTSPATAPPSTPVETFAESVDVSVVNVEVYVTDREGKRVQGLKREDFELSEDGRPVTISNFYAVNAGDAAAAELAAAETSGTPSPNVAPAANPTPPVPDAQHLYLALFVDEQSLTVQARNRMIPALKSFVARRLQPGDRVLLASYNGAVKVLQTPTENPGAISAAFSALEKGSAHGTEVAIDRRRVLDELSLSANSGRFAGSEASRTYGEVRLLAQADYDQVRATVRALSQFVDSLAGLPGRKAILLVSGGMSQRPAEALYEAWQNKFGRFSSQVGASRFDAFHQQTGRLFEELVEHANANRVTFYTIAVPEELSGVSAESAGTPEWTPGLTALENINQTQPLQILAGATGGLAAVDKTTFLLDRLRADLDTYYSLGYVPTHPPDGKKHKLAVKVRNRDLVVRVREGYRARTGPEVTSSRTLSALLLGEGGNPFGVSLAIQGEKPSPKGQYAVSLLVKLPMAKLTLVPQGGVHEGRVRVYVGARDAEGRMSDINEVVLPFHVTEEQLPTVASQNVGTRVTLLLRPGRHTLAVGVRDELGNTDSTVTGVYTAGRLTKGDGKGKGK
jgi:VWFA-related protein